MNLADNIRDHLEAILNRPVGEGEIKYYKDLTIALASNPQMFYMAFDDDGVPQLDWDDDAFDRNAGNIKRQADAIIAEMEK